MGESQSDPALQTDLLDYHQLETFVVIGIADYLELLSDVVRDVPVQIEQIRAAIRQNDLSSLQTRTHSLRGLLAYFGCVAMTARLLQLENQASVEPGAADAIHRELTGLWDKSLAALREWEKTLPDSGS